jgi:hypothetical protein
MADSYIGQGYSDYIGTRTKPGQTQVEYYNKQNNMAFGTPQEVFGYASTLAQKPVGSFEDIQAGFAPRAQALDTIKNDLNAYQQQTFDSQQPSNQRKSSSITDSINSQQGDLDKYLSEYNDLRTKLSSIAAPNFQDSYNQLRQQQGIPGFEQDYANLSQQRRELPYVERANTGNAGVATEAQLAAQTDQKDVPLYIQQGNALDRLKLAQDFITNSLNLKGLDYNASRQSLLDAANLTGQTIDFTRSSLNDLLQRQQYEQQLQQQAQDFAIQNGIDAPLYQVGNVLYDTATRTPKYLNNGGTLSTVDGKTTFSEPSQFFSHSGIKSFDQIYHINSTTVADKNAVLNLRSKYPDAGISASDSFAVASGKLQNSRIYQDQVRGPVGSGGGSPLASLFGDPQLQAILANPALFNNLTPTVKTQLLPQLIALGFNPLSGTDISKSKDAIAAFGDAENQLNTLEGLAKKVITAGGPVGALYQRLSQGLGAKTKASPDAALYNDTVSAFLSSLSRAAGEKGVLTDQDVARIKSALPAFSDTADIANAKLETLRNLFKAKKQSAVNAYGGTYNGGQSNNDPLGIR